MAGQNPSPNVDLFDVYFRKADLDQDGRITGNEAVAFFQGSNLPKNVLAQVLFLILPDLSLYKTFSNFYLFHLVVLD